MTAEDALLAIENGADAIYVSNHGGRQLDCLPPTLRVLEDICKAVNKRVPVVKPPRPLRKYPLTDDQLTQMSSISTAESAGDPIFSRLYVSAQTWYGLVVRHCGQ